ncbi:MAG: NADP-specific glutamate dehydrogenase [Eubacteriales bacterium]|nr:NADP-specific glutamate dehydrogenase [Eubacteriales bacterium]
MNQYAKKILEEVKQKNQGEEEFLQAVEEFFSSLSIILDNDKKYEENSILERIAEPERIIIFRVPWVDDKGNIKVNRGYRVQFNSAIGPYKGGLRLHPSVNLSILKFLGFEQIFKNALTTLPMGGAKGGSDFDPKGKSDREVMAFCQSFMQELYRHIGANVDVPAGDIGTGAREIGYLFGEYKKLANSYEGVLTGKNLLFGGSLVRTEATGYGLLYFAENFLQDNGKSVKNANINISGSGNVAIFAAEKAIAMGAKVRTLSDSNGFIYDENGIDLELVKDIKLNKRERIKKYVDKKSSATYYENKKPYIIPCDIYLPCATQNEIDIEGAKELVKNKCFGVFEGANMPTTIDATNYLMENNVLFAPGKASNAGGVSVSGLEMSQNSERLSWTFEEVDKMLKDIMQNIYTQAKNASNEYNLKNNLVVGANIAGFKKVANAMIMQGVV